MINPRVADLRKKAALLRSQAHLLETEAQQIEDAENPHKKKGDNHTIAPAAGTFVLGRE